VTVFVVLDSPIESSWAQNSYSSFEKQTQKLKERKKESCKQADKQRIFRTCTVIFYYKICSFLQSCVLYIT